MITDLMEAWSLEEGDQILVAGNIYRVIDISADWSTDADEYALLVVDEEGYKHEIIAVGSKKFRLVLDTLATID